MRSAASSSSLFAPQVNHPSAAAPLFPSGLSATRSGRYLTSPRARSLYPPIDLCLVTLLFPNKTTLGFNDLGADRWAPSSDLWALGSDMTGCSPALRADWSRAKRWTLTVDAITLSLLLLFFFLPLAMSSRRQGFWSRCQQSSEESEWLNSFFVGWEASSNHYRGISYHRVA